MLSIAVMQERVATPSTCTVQAPHSAMPQPNLVPVMPSTSRNTQRSGVSPSTSMLCVLPLTLMFKAMAPLLSALSELTDPAQTRLIATLMLPPVALKSRRAIAAQVRDDHPAARRRQQRRDIDIAVNIVGPAVQKNNDGPVGWAGLSVADLQDAGIDLLQ